MISKEPTNKLFVFHFGNGDEEDQRVLIDFCKQFGAIDQIPLFPGLNYGFVEFPKVEDAIKLVDTLQDSKFVELEFYDKKRVCCFQYSKLEYSEMDKFKSMEFPDSTYDHDIPGLILVDEFISPEEEKDLKEWFDTQEWTKLMNRRVQHFGYEFVYGANNVNKNEKIRDMPGQGDADADVSIGVSDRVNRNFVFLREFNFDFLSLSLL